MAAAAAAAPDAQDSTGHIDVVAGSTVVAADNAVEEEADMCQQVAVGCMRDRTVLGMALGRQDALQKQTQHFGAFADAADNADRTRLTYTAVAMLRDRKKLASQMVGRHYPATADEASETAARSFRLVDSHIHWVVSALDRVAKMWERSLYCRMGQGLRLGLWRREYHRAVSAHDPEASQMVWSLPLMGDWPSSKTPG